MIRHALPNSPSSAAEPGRRPLRLTSLTVAGQIVVAQFPVLPQLQRRQQNHHAAQAGMPVAQQPFARVAEQIRRDGEPDAEAGFRDLLPALQHDIFKLRQEEHQHADNERIGDGNTIIELAREPGRQSNQQTGQHAQPIFPRAMNTEKTHVQHRGLLLRKRHTSIITCPPRRTTV